MVSTVEYNLGELMHVSRMIYFTNQPPSRSIKGSRARVLFWFEVFSMVLKFCRVLCSVF